MHFAETAAANRFDNIEIVRFETTVHDQAARLLVALNEVVDAFLTAKRWYITVRVDRLQTVLVRNREQIRVSFLENGREQTAVQNPKNRTYEQPVHAEL